MEPTPTVRVKRDGPRGYRCIAADKFDPKVHELFTPPAEGGAEQPEAKPAKKSGKKAAEGGAE